MEKQHLGRLVLWFVGLAMFSFFWGWIINEVGGSQLAYMSAPVLWIIFTFRWFARWFLSPDKKQYEIGRTAGLKEMDAHWSSRVGLWYIWSNEHKAWWKSGHGGYTQDKDEAGRYTFEQACNIVRGANQYRKDDEFPYEAMIQV